MLWPRSAVSYSDSRPWRKYRDSVSLRSPFGSDCTASLASSPGRSRPRLALTMITAVRHLLQPHSCAYSGNVVGRLHTAAQPFRDSLS